MYGKEYWKEQHILSPKPGRKSLEITLKVGGMKSATKRVLQRVIVKGIPGCASTGVLGTAASWSAWQHFQSLMIHDTKSPLASAPNTWNQFYNLQTAKSVKDNQSFSRIQDLVIKDTFKKKHALFWDVFGLCLLWYFSLNHGSIHLLNWLGKDAQSKWCRTVSTDSPDHREVDLSFLDKFDAFVHNEPVVPNW